MYNICTYKSTNFFNNYVFSFSSPVFTGIISVSKRYTNFIFDNLNKLIDNLKNNKNDNDRKIVIKLSCRLILRINISLLLKYKYLNDIEIFDMDYLVSVLSETIKIIFQFLQNSNMEINEKNANLNVDNKNSTIDSGMIMKKDLLSYGDLGNVLDDFIFQNNIDLLLEFQTFLWINLPNFIHELIVQDVNNYDYHDSNIKYLLLLLDIAIFSAGIIRYIWCMVAVYDRCCISHSFSFFVYYYLSCLLMAFI